MKKFLNLIDKFCFILCGSSLFLIGLSFLYDIGVVILTGSTGRPSQLSWIGLFGVLSSQMLFIGIHLATWTLPEFME